VKEGISSQNADGRENYPIYLTALKNEAFEASDKKETPTDLCEGSTQAFVLKMSDTLWWKRMKDTVGTEASPPGDAWTVNFCEGFFKTADLTAKLQQLKDGASKTEICNLENLDNTG